MHSHWRDCKAWEVEGLPLSTTSNEACKMYDATLTQLMAFREDDSLGGLAGTFTKLTEADPNFVLGKALKAFYSNNGSIRTNPDYKRDMLEVEELAKQAELTQREKTYLEAIKSIADGQHLKGAAFLEDIILEHPTDLFALKIAQFIYIMHGRQKEVRDSIARVLPFWKSHIPLYGYLHGMYAFGLHENGNSKMAEEVGLKGLDINRKDIWASHAVCHSYEMTGRSKQGVAFAESIANEWDDCNLLACHNYWHLSLFHIDNGDYDSALAVYDNEVAPRVLLKPFNVFKMSDAASSLRRLEFEGVNVGHRWKELHEVSKSSLENETQCFYDYHNFCVCLGAKEKESANKITDFVRNLMSSSYSDTYPSTYQFVHKTGTALFEGIQAFDDGDYARTVELLYPIRYDFVDIGGSDAQRDLFQFFLLHAALKSPNVFHAKLARSLIYERQANRGDSLMTQRLLAQILTHHPE